MASKLILAVLLLFSFTAQADTSVLVGGFSTHLSDRDYNSFHRLLVVEKDTYFGGYFRNSYYQDTFIVGKNFRVNNEVGILSGLTYGYREDSNCYKYQGMDNYSDRIVCPYVGLEFGLELPYRPTFLIFGNAIVLGFKL